jgi:putative oxidoreductase
MDRIVTRAAPSLYTLLRIIGALLYACHGAQKLLGLFGGVRGGTVPLLSLMGLAGLIELGAGLLIAGGVLTRPAAFLASGEMAFAYWLSHAPRGFWPIRNGGEVAVLNCFLFLYIASQGAGPWSLAQLEDTAPCGAAADGTSLPIGVRPCRAHHISPGEYMFSPCLI